MANAQAMDAPKIDVKSAANIAVDSLTSFFPNVDQILLEEVELSDDRKYWFITLSYAMTPEETPLTVIAIGKPRKYKQFKIETDSGQVMSMKIREVK